MEERANHFFKPEMLKSQFKLLEEPENAIGIVISGSMESIISDVMEKIKAAV